MRRRSSSTSTPTDPAVANSGPFRVARNSVANALTQKRAGAAKHLSAGDSAASAQRFACHLIAHREDTPFGTSRRQTIVALVERKIGSYRLAHVSRKASEVSKDASVCSLVMLIDHQHVSR